MISIEQTAQAVFPGLRVSAFSVDKFVSAAEKVDLTSLERRIQNAATEKASMIRSWRPVYQHMGLKPSKFLSSVEALSKRAAKAPNGWKTGDCAVDVYNAVSIIHGAPLGCYDTTALKGANISIRPVDRAVDTFSPVGGTVDLSKGNENLLVYAAHTEILCWALNYRDSAQFCVRPNTSEALVVSESTTQDQYKASLAALNDLSEILECHGASITWHNQPPSDLNKFGDRQ